MGEHLSKTLLTQDQEGPNQALAITTPSAAKQIERAYEQHEAEDPSSPGPSTSDEVEKQISGHEKQAAANASRGESDRT